MSQKSIARDKASLPLILGLLILIAFVLSGHCFASGTPAVNTETAELMRQDIVRFQGPAGEDAPPTDGYVVSVNRIPNGQTSTNYVFELKGLDPVERTLFEDAKSGKENRFDLFRATLIAGGVRDAQKIRDYEAKLDNVLAAVYAKVGNKPSPENLTKEVFEAIHRQLLTNTYDINCTDLVRTLETGHFNCVSATILFNCVAEKAGLNVCALEMPGHALSRVHFGSESMNLETTCPNWFALQDEAARREATARRVAPAATAHPGVAGTQKNDEPSKKLREISPIQLVATIYYNQGVDFLAEEKFAEAIVANLKALQLDPHSEMAWGNLLAAINNWSIKLVGENRRFDLAASLLDQGVCLDPSYDKFRENQLHIYYHWISALDYEGRTVDAKKVFEIADKRLPNNTELRALMQSMGK
jgi:tetratricopeptide (TPR) repeat protein